MAYLGLVVPLFAAGGWLWFIRQSDRYEKEPWSLVLRTAGLGAALGLLGLVLWVALTLTELEGLQLLLVMTPVHVGAITLVLRLLPYRRPEWNEPFDGIVYGGAAGIGYGLVFTLTTLIESPLAGFRTGLYAIPIYMLAGLVIGHYQSQLRYGAPGGAAQAWARGLLIPALYVAGFQLTEYWGGTVMGDDNPVASAFVYGVNTVGWVMAMWAMDAQGRSSQFNPENYRLNLAGVGCAGCGEQQMAGARFCHRCGRPQLQGQGVQ